jgi:hypothetical protein
VSAGDLGYPPFGTQRSAARGGGAGRRAGASCPPCLARPADCLIRML